MAILKVKFIFLLIVISLSACDNICIYTYRIKNETSNEIKVKLNYYEYSKEGKYLVENLIIIEPGRIDTVHHISGLGGRISDFEENDTITGFNTISIFMNDSLLKSENLKLRNKWDYHRINSSMADYDATIK